MSVGRRSSTTSYAPQWKTYAPAAVVDCIADSPDGASCAGKVIPLSAGNFTVLKDADGVDRPIASVPAGFIHKADVSAVTCSVACVVYWGRNL